LKLITTINTGGETSHRKGEEGLDGPVFTFAQVNQLQPEY